MIITKSELQKYIGLKTPHPWDELYIEVARSSSGICRAYTRGDSLPFYADGYGYDKVSVVLGRFLNYYLNTEATEAIGSGVEQVKEDALKHGIKLQFISYTKSGQLYHFSKIGV